MVLGGGIAWSWYSRGFVRGYPCREGADQANPAPYYDILHCYTYVVLPYFV